MTADRIIKVDIVQGDIEHRLTLQEFRDRLHDKFKDRMKTEIGSVTMTFTAKGFSAKVDGAFDKAFNRAIDDIIQEIRDGRVVK